MKPNLRPIRIKAAIALIGATLLSAASTQAVDRFWTAGTATWNNAANWTPVGVPNNDNAIVTNGGTVVISSGDPTWVPFDLRAGDGLGNTGHYIQNGGTITMNSWFRMGIGGGTGSYDFNGGTLSTKRFILGDGAGSVGVFNQTNGDVTVVNDEVWIGQNNSSGTYNMSGGTLNYNSWFALGRGNGTGILNLTNGVITKTGSGGRLIVGANATGTLNQYGGTVVSTVDDTWIAEGSGTGIWNLLGGTAMVSILNCAQGGTATLNLGGTGVLIAKEIKPNGGTGTINFNGGTLQAGVSTTALLHDIGSALVNSNANLDTAGFNVTVAQPLIDGGFGGGFVKSGAGTAKLTGVNTYTGQTTVKAGKLNVTTTTATVGGLVVSNSAGYGVTVAAANAQVSPASATLGSSAATTLDLDLSNFGNPTLAPLNVTGNLAVNGTVTVNVADTLPQVGQFPLIKYGTKTGSGSFTLGPLPVGVSATLVNNVGNSSIDLNITSTALIRWDGRVAGGVWDINTTTNWTDYITSASAKFNNGVAVFFDDVALGTTTVNLGVTVNPGAVIFVNNTLPYTLTGNGAIGGAIGLAKQGSNTVTIATTNTYTGATTISGGTVNISKLANGGSPSPIGSSSSSAANLVFDGGTLNYTGPATSTDRGYSLTSTNPNAINLANDLTISGTVSAAGDSTFSKTGAGKLTYTHTGSSTLAIHTTGIPAYNINDGTVVLDGSNGGSTYSTSGDIWVGGTTNSTGGILVVTNSTLNISTWLAIARGTGTGGYNSGVTAYNSKLTSGNMSLGYDAGIPGTWQTSYLSLNGNTTYTNGGDSNWSETSGSSATITLNDSSVFYSAGRMQIGWHNNSTGAVVVANSAKIVVNAWMSIGNEGGVGSVLVKDNASIYCGDLNVCDVNTGTAVLTVTNSGKALCNALFVGKGAGSVATMTIWTGASSVGQNNGGSYVEIGSQVGASGTLNLIGGTLSARRIRSVNTGSGTINFNGGLLKAAADAGQGVDRDFMNNLTAANIFLGGLTLDTSTNTAAVGQALLGDVNGDGGLTKLGTGSLFLNGFNSYTNKTLVSFGTLGGNGTIAGPVSVAAGAALAPGDGLGTLTINNNLTLTGNLLIDINTTNTASTATNDFVAVSGTLVNNGTGTVTVNNLGTLLNVGDSFTLFSQPVVNGAALTVLPSAGATWINNLAVDGSIKVASLAGPPSFAPNGVTRLNNGNVVLTATGIVGTPYSLWATTNLTLTPISSTWTLLSSGTVPSSTFTITDTTAAGLPQRFYIFSKP